MTTLTFEDGVEFSPCRGRRRGVISNVVLLQEHG